MILILGMKHQAMKLYKVCINHDLGMTLTFLRHGQLRPPMHLNGKNRKKCHLKGKTCSKLANGLNLYDLKKKLTPEVALTLTWGYIHNTILVKQVYWYISQVSGERLQDHWSSGLCGTWLETLKSGFLASWLIYIKIYFSCLLSQFLNSLQIVCQETAQYFFAKLRHNTDGADGSEII